MSRGKTVDLAGLAASLKERLTVPEYFEDPHTYALKGGGALVGASELLKAQGFIQDAFFNKEAALRGQVVHAAVAYDGEGDLNWRQFKRVNPDKVGYVQACRAFRHQAGFKSLLAEQCVANKLYRLAGTFDDLGVGPDGELWLVDYKTGKAPWYAAYQLAVYGACLPVPAKRFTVELRPDGTYQLSKDLNDHRVDQVIRSAAQVYWTIKEKGVR